MACDLKKRPGSRALQLPVWLAVAGLAAGCGAGTPSQTTAAASAAAAAARKPVNPADARLRTMVNAVPSNKPSTLPVQVKFELKERPEVAQPLEIGLVIVPLSAAVDRVSGAIEADDGLELIEGATIAATDRPPEGVPIEHALKVLPRHDGIFTFRVKITVDAGGQTSSETYSMPVIAGEGIGPAPKPTPPGSKPAPSPKTAAVQ